MFADSVEVVKKELRFLVWKTDEMRKALVLSQSCDWRNVSNTPKKNCKNLMECELADDSKVRKVTDL